MGLDSIDRGMSDMRGNQRWRGVNSGSEVKGDGCKEEEAADWVVPSQKAYQRAESANDWARLRGLQ